MGATCSKADNSSGKEAADTSSYRESVLDIRGKPVSTKAEQGGQASNETSTSGVPRLKNIFAAPVKVLADYVFPVYDKSSDEKNFIEAAVKDNFIFSGVEKTQLANLLNAFQGVNSADGEIIITEGEVGDYFYIIEEGSVKFTVKGKLVGEAAKGASFGDLALLYDCPRAATCTANGSCKLWRVEQGAFRQILANTTINKDKGILDTLRKVPFLKDLEIEYLNKMANVFETKTFPAGTQIIKKGDQGLEFYVVKDGKVTIQDIEAGGRTFDDQVLEDGDYFGERAIVKEEPRVANIFALTDVTALTLSREKFIEVIGPLEQLIMKTNDLMILKGIPSFARSDVKPAEYKLLASRIVYKSVEAEEYFYEKDDTKGSGIYFLHSGKVKLVEEKKEVTEGGYFGIEDSVLTETTTGTAVAMETCKVGYLSKESILGVIAQLARIYEGARRKPIRMTSVLKDAIPVDSLTKHRILGVGTFGKVWLVTNGKHSKEAYALKVQRKIHLLQHQQVQGVMREMSVMAKLNHPFVLKLMNVYQDAESVLMLVKLIQGGELYGIMKRAKNGILAERDAKFYASGVLEGLAYMHSFNILYRDLKPENVLIGADGYPVIVDLGFAKEVPDKTFTLCGTPWYIAPEVILGRGHDKACDHWSWAILVHEMVSGDTPFAGSGRDQMSLFKAIVRGNYKISRLCPPAVTNLVQRVLITRPSNRLGSLAGSDMDLKTHDWLVEVSFDRLRQKRFKAPWKPEVKDALDVSQYDNWDHMAKDEPSTPLNAAQQKSFDRINVISKELLGRV